MGDTRFQKTFNANYLTKYRVKNTGKLPQYYRENTHPAIIDREIWELVQLEMARQKQYVEIKGPMSTVAGSSRSILIGQDLICLNCSCESLIHS